MASKKWGPPTKQRLHYVRGTDIQVRRAVRYPGRIKQWYRFENQTYDWQTGPVPDQEVEIR